MIRRCRLPSGIAHPAKRNRFLVGVLILVFPPLVPNPGFASLQAQSTHSFTQLLSPCTTGTSPPLFHDFRNFALLMPGCTLALKRAQGSSSGCARSEADER
jgi:hypothetical protein